MGFYFTIAITPSTTNIDRELQYIKSALLYADEVTLISPIAYFYAQLVNNNQSLDERAFIRTFNLVIPLCKDVDPVAFQNSKAAIKRYTQLIYSKQYKKVPRSMKQEFRQQLIPFALQCENILETKIGKTQAMELQRLLESKKIKLYKFEHDLSDGEGFAPEFFQQLQKAVKTSYPLFDESANDLISTAVRAKVISFSDIERRKISHAGVSDNMIKRLPSFEFAAVDEILDIRKDLDSSLSRYRAKVLEYSDSIQTMPWDDDFGAECSILYNKEVVPAILEIEERTKENTFLKNLGYSFLSSENFFRSLGGLVAGVAAGGVISTVSQVMSTDAAMVVSGGAWAANKIADAYRNYSDKKKEIQKKDLYFYYQAGKRLEKAMK